MRRSTKVRLRRKNAKVSSVVVQLLTEHHFFIDAL